MSCLDPKHIPPDEGVQGEHEQIPKDELVGLHPMELAIVALYPDHRLIGLALRDEIMTGPVPALLMNEKGCVELIINLQKALHYCRLLPVPPVEAPMD